MSSDVIRLLVLALVFAAVVLGIEGGMRWYRTSRGGAMAVNKRLRLIASGFDRPEVLARLRRDTWGDAIRLPGFLAGPGKKLDTTLRTAGFGLSPGRTFVLIVAVLFMLTIFGAVIFGFRIGLGTVLMAACFATAAGMVLPLMLIAQRAERRRKKMAEQFPVALDIFVRGLRAGHPVASALDLLTQEMTDPIGSEFGIVTDEVAYGAELRDALQNMADRCDLDDLRMFVVSLSVRALSSEGRMTGTILTALPVMAFVALFLLNPPFYLQVAGDPAFSIGFGCLIGLYLIGFFIIRRLINIKV
jgi:tight adherence protein B